MSLFTTKLRDYGKQRKENAIASWKKAWDSRYSTTRIIFGLAANLGVAILIIWMVRYGEQPHLQDDIQFLVVAPFTLAGVIISLGVITWNERRFARKVQEGTAAGLK